MGHSKTLCVTVGSTRFNELIFSINQLSFLSTCKSLGYTHIIIQHGNSPLSQNSLLSDLDVYTFPFSSELAQVFEKADVVITHCGSGNCLELLDAKKKFITVVNPSLADNHQQELAEKMSKCQYSILCPHPTVEELINALKLIESFNPSQQSFSSILNINQLLDAEMQYI